MARVTRIDIRQAARQIAMVLGALALLDIGFYALFARPAQRRYEVQREQHEPEDKALQDWEKSVARRESFVVAVRQAGEDLRRLREDVLSDRDVRMIEAQAELARLATEFNIDLDSVVYGSEVLLDEELERFAMDVPLEGSYASLRQFLQAVEQSDKFLVVESVALARGREGGEMLNLTISLATYFNAPPEMVKRSREGVRPGSRRARS